MIFPIAPQIKSFLKKEELEEIKKVLLTSKITFNFGKEKLELSLLEMLIFLIYLKIKELKYLSTTCRKNLYIKLVKEIGKSNENLESFIIVYLTLFAKITLNLYFFSHYNLTEFTYILISPPSLFENYKTNIIENKIRKITGKYPKTFVSIQLNLNTILFEELKEENEIYANLLNQHQDRFDKPEFNHLSPEEKIVEGIEELKNTLPYTLEEITISLKNFLAILKGKEFDLNKFSQLNELLEFGDIGFKKDKGKKKYIIIEQKEFLKKKSGKLSKN